MLIAILSPSMSGQGFNLEGVLNNNLLTRLLFAGVIDAIEDIIFIADCDDRIVYANPAAIKRFEYPLEEFLGKKSNFIGSPENPPGTDQMIWRETVKKGCWKGEVLNRTKSGEDFPVYLTTGVVVNEKGEKVALTGVAKDISKIKKTQSHLQETAKRLEVTNQKLRKAQRQLVNSEKLAALGVFSSGLAHEIGNPISSISSLVQVMKRQIDKDSNLGSEFQEKMTNKFETIMGQVDRVHGILRQMTELSQSRMLIKERIDIVPVLEESIDRAQFQKDGKKVRVVTDIESDELHILVLKDQLSQVFVNIILNALDSMKDGGVLNIRVFVQDSKVVVRFHDTGCGIEADDYQKVFEPFFTTKSQNKGLGLSVSYSIIQSFGGDISVQSQKDEGTVVTVKLPWVKRGRTDEK